MTSNGAPAGAGLTRKHLIVIIALMAVLIGVLLGAWARGAIWEGWLIDRQFQIRALVKPVPVETEEPVVVVGLDRIALASDRLASIPRVFMTPVLAEAGQAVFDAGATAVGYDFVFAFSADAFKGPSSDEGLLKGYDRPFLGFLYKNRGRVFVARTSTGNPFRAISAAAGTSGVRLAEVTPDSDGVVRRHTPQLPLETSPLFLDALLGQTGQSLSEPYTAVPKARLASSLPYLSLLDVMELIRTPQGQQTLQRFVEGKIVLFGSTMPNEDEHLYSDRYLPVLDLSTVETGVSGRPPVRHATAGVFVLADLIGSAVAGRTVKDVPTSYILLAAFGFALAGAVSGLFMPLAAVPVAMILGLVSAIGANLVGIEFGFLLSPGVGPVAFCSALAVAVLGKVGLLQRGQRAMVKLFGHYLSPEVIRDMVRSEQLPALGGERRNVVVVFIDIVGFTRMSERLADKDIVEVVNTCFEAIGQAITHHQGYIDKYIGDAVMAVWNAPNTVANPETAAIAASEEILGLLDSLREKTGQPELDLRIALNGGAVLVGDIGGVHRRSFTVMGTTVNTASRIEGVAKEANVRLAMSESVANNLPQSISVRQIWRGALRGLSTETSVYTLDKPTVEMSAPEQVGEPVLLRNGSV